MNAGKANPRRRFMATLVAGAAALGVSRTPAHGAAMRAAQANQDAWLDQVKGSHRCLFDFPAHKLAVPLLHMNNYLSTYADAYGTTAGQVGAVGTLYGVGSGASIVMGFDDFVWKKYALGEYTGLRTASGQPYTTNVFNAPTEADGHLLAKAMDVLALPILGGAIVASSIPALQKRGATFLMCNNALMAWTFELAARGKGEQPVINEELRAHLLPGIVVVPAMVIAIERAQKAGVGYNRQ